MPSGRSATPDKVLSLTAAQHDAQRDLPAPVDKMQRCADRGLGELWLHATPRPLFAALFRAQGLADRRAMSTEIYAYDALLTRLDRGRAFLRIMRGFDLTEEKQRFLWEGLADRLQPARIVWGERDPALGIDLLRVARRSSTSASRCSPWRFLQEDQAPALYRSPIRWRRSANSPARPDRSRC